MTTAVLGTTRMLPLWLLDGRRVDVPARVLPRHRARRPGTCRRRLAGLPETIVAAAVEACRGAWCVAWVFHADGIEVRVGAGREADPAAAVVLTLAGYASHGSLLWTWRGPDPDGDAAVGRLRGLGFWPLRTERFELE